MQNFSYENEFDLHENELVGETHFHKNGFALGLVLTQRQTRSWKWAILITFYNDILTLIGRSFLLVNTFPYPSTQICR